MIHRLATHAMGTRFELVLAGEAEAPLRAAGEEAVAVIQEWHARLSRFEPASQLSFINRTAADRPVPIDEDLMGLLQVCAAVHQVSGGAFDPTVAPAMDELARAARPAVVRGMSCVELDGPDCRVAFTRPGVALDLGGIAKGFALDRAEATLRACGVRAALLHGGTSSIAAIGAPHGAPGWGIAVPGGTEGLRLELRDVHLSVSAAAGRLFGNGSAHIMDPRGLGAVPMDRVAVVLGASGAECEAWSTALAVLGDRPPRMPAEMTSALLVNGTWRIEGAQAAAMRVEGPTPRSGVEAA
jgi:FAD:protein FMN transferase